TSLTPIWRIASTMFWPCETRTSTCLSFATFSSGLYRFLAIAVLLDVKDIPQVGPLQWGWINHPSDNEAYSGMRRDKCGENEETLIIGENGYSWEHEDELRCRYSSGKARFDNTIAASTKTVGVWVFHINAGCVRRPAEGSIKNYTQSFDMYVSKGALWIENLRSDEKP